MKSEHIRLQALSKKYGAKAAVSDLTLDIEPGSLVALLGPSGCGKSTALRMIAGLIAPTSGDILLNGRSVLRTAVHRRNVGMLFQSYALFPHMSVADNVAFGLRMRSVGKKDIAERVVKALDMVQLGEFASRLPKELSGGQQQRVALARAIVIEPSMLLLDEPLGALDKGLREAMQVEVRALQRRLGLTTIMVTHDQDEALTMADKIVLMREGKLVQEGTAQDIYSRPRTSFVANFIGASNLFRGTVLNSNDGGSVVLTTSGQRLSLEVSRATGEEVTVSVRPESISVRPLANSESLPELNAMRARVEQVIYRGFMTQLTLSSEGLGPIQAFLQNAGPQAASPFAVGATVIAHWTPKSNHPLERQ